MGVRILRWVPLALAVVAEGAWTWVLAGFADELVLRPQALPLPVYVGGAAVGVLAARLVSARLGPRWPWVALGFVLVAAGIGVLAAAGSRDVLLARGVFGVLRAVRLNPGGVLLGLAVLRGFGHAHLPLSEERLGRLLVGGIATIAILALVGSLVGEPSRSRFLADALTGALLFSANALLALALTRLTVVAGDSGADWASNPPWLGLLLALVAAVEVLAAPAAGIIGSTVELVFWLSIGPILVIGLIVGWTRNTLRAVALVLVLAVIFVVILPFVAGTVVRVIGSSGVATGIASSTQQVDPGVATVSLGLGGIAVLAIVLLLIRSWMRRVQAAPDDLLDTRTIDRSGDGVARSWRPHLPFRPGPHDAVAAYRRLLEELAGRPTVARSAGETPAEHARRLRGDGWGRLGLELLAADYELVRFAGRTLSGSEDRRGIRRWRRLREDLHPAPILRPERTIRGPRRRDLELADELAEDLALQPSPDPGDATRADAGAEGDARRESGDREGTGRPGGELRP